MTARNQPTLITTMTAFPHHIDFRASLAEARAMMSDRACRHLPVMKHGELFGIVTEQGLLLATTCLGPLAKERTVGDVCSEDPLVVDSHAPLGEVLVELARKRQDAALVTRNGALAGILTTTDVCRAFAAWLEPPADSAA